MDEEVVAVPSRGAERWLSQRLAERLDANAGSHASTGRRAVCAGVRFPFPGALMDHIVSATEQDTATPKRDPWRADALTWQVLAELDALRDGPVDEALLPLRHHLERDEAIDATRRLPLARRIAETFDQYGLLRPKLVAAWEAHDDRRDGDDSRDHHGSAFPVDLTTREEPLPDSEAWQPVLWRRLRDRIAAPSPAVRRERAIAALADPDPPLRARLGQVLPRRVAVFGVTALPPAHLRLLAALGEAIDEVTLYLLSPSQQLGISAQTASDDTVLEPRNPLLSSLGRLSIGMAEFLRSQQLPGHLRVTHSQPEPAHQPATSLPEPTVLQSIQASIREDRPATEVPAATNPAGADQTPRPRGAFEGAQESAGAEGSVQVHGCHGPTRQVEVLREVLTGLLSADPSLQPRDILVMTPDLDTFAPLISAVFDEVPGPRQDGQPALPARIADRRLDRSNEVAALLGSLLDLAGARLAASAVLDVLDTLPVRNRFGLDDADLERVTSWVRDTATHWGADAQHRGAHGQPEEAQHTWQAGLDRLRAGAAMADEDGRTIAGVVPYDHLEGEQLDRLGRAVTAIDTLIGQVRALETPATPAVWRDRLRSALDALTSVDRAATWQRQQALELLDELVEAADGCAVEVTLSELRGEVRAKLGRRPTAARYATGAITVCELAPLRAVPHRVVCLLGLDDGAFPRTAAPLGFDLVGASRQTQPGDRNPRDEDRQLLLDAVLAARGHLVATYTSRDPHNNDPRPPAAPLAETLEAMAGARGLPAERAEELVTQHPLQPYDTRYFVTSDASDEAPADQPALPQSFAPHHLAAARALHGPRRAQVPFAGDVLPAPTAAEKANGDPGAQEGERAAASDEDRSLPLATLEDFHHNPVRHLLRSRLGVGVALGEDRVNDRDQWDLDALATWRLRESCLQHWLEGHHETAIRELLALEQARGAVPPGAPGRHALDRVVNEAEAIVDVLAQEGPDGTPLRPSHMERRDLGARVAVPAAALAGAAATLALPTAGDTTPPDALAAVQLMGTVAGHAAQRLIMVQASRIDARAELRGWLRLLAASIATSPDAGAAPDGPGAHGPVRILTIVGHGARPHERITRLALPVDDPVGFAHARLAELIALYHHGLQRALPLLPRTTKALAKAMIDARKKKEENEAQEHGTDQSKLTPAQEALGCDRTPEKGSLPKSAYGAWHGGAFGAGEGEDEAVTLAFGPSPELDEVLDDELLRVARHVWTPIVAAIERAKETDG